MTSQKRKTDTKEEKLTSQIQPLNFMKFKNPTIQLGTELFPEYNPEDFNKPSALPPSNLQETKNCVKCFLALPIDALYCRKTSCKAKQTEKRETNYQCDNCSRMNKDCTVDDTHCCYCAFRIQLSPPSPPPREI